MKTVLFIGNSFTYYNDLPGMVAEMFEKAGYDYQIMKILFAVQRHCARC